MMYGFMRATQRRAPRQLGSDELQIHHGGGDESETLELGAQPLWHNTNSRTRLFSKAEAILKTISDKATRRKRNK